jgi:myo-inositol-1(or 4)-monophosphatase
MRENEIHELLVRLAIQAGRIARDEQQGARGEIKADQSYVTDVDLRLSELSRRVLGDVVPEHHIITEEHLEHLEAINDSSPGGEEELLAIVDPIDGTRNYYHNMPLYGFSVGILRNRKPWMGVVLFPAQEEMVHCDGRDAYYARDVFADEPESVVLHKTPNELEFNSIVLCSEALVGGYRWDYEKYHLLQTGCATINLCWPAMGRGVAAIFGAHPWDLAGSWPVLAQTGFILRGLRSGKGITRYDPADYDPVTHKVTQPIIVCRPDHYGSLASAVSPLD